MPDRHFDATLRVRFVADDQTAAQTMGEELLRIWNERVQPDIPSTLADVTEVVE